MRRGPSHPVPQSEMRGVVDKVRNDYFSPVVPPAVHRWRVRAPGYPLREVGASCFPAPTFIPLSSHSLPCRETNRIVDWEPSRPILQTLQPRKLSGGRPRDSPGWARGVCGGGEGQATKPWATSGKAPTPPRAPEPPPSVQRNWDCLVPAMYYLWNFTIYGISSLETG